MVRTAAPGPGSRGLGQFPATPRPRAAACRAPAAHTRGACARYCLPCLLAPAWTSHYSPSHPAFLLVVFPTIAAFACRPGTSGREQKRRPPAIGTNALVRGATQLRPTVSACFEKQNSPMKHQGAPPASLFRYGQTSLPIPQPCNGSSRFSYSDLRPFAFQLRGPFSAAVSGRTFTKRLLSRPSCGAYSSSSAPY
jgi:hypothetical protein